MGIVGLESECLREAVWPQSRSHGKSLEGREKETSD